MNLRKLFTRKIESIKQRLAELAKIDIGQEGKRTARQVELSVERGNLQQELRHANGQLGKNADLDRRIARREREEQAAEAEIAARLEGAHLHRAARSGRRSQAGKNLEAARSGDPRGSLSREGFDRMTLVWGWALVSTRDGEPYWNEEGYHVPESVMVKAAVEFMTGTREAQVMHDGRRAGTVIHAFPLTSDIAKAMGIAANQTGLMVGVQFDDPAVVDKIEKGELTGFSPAFEAFSIPAGA